MCKAAAYESKGLRDDAFAKRYYKEDYMDFQRLKLRVWTTVFYVIYWIYFFVKEFHLNLPKTSIANQCYIFVFPLWNATTTIYSSDQL